MTSLFRGHPSLINAASEQRVKRAKMSFKRMVTEDISPCPQPHRLRLPFIREKVVEPFSEPDLFLVLETFKDYTPSQPVWNARLEALGVRGGIVAYYRKPGPVVSEKPEGRKKRRGGFFLGGAGDKKELPGLRQGRWL